MEVTKSIDITAQPENIWPFMYEPMKILEWYIPLQKFKYTSNQRNKVGAPIYFEEKTTGGTIKLNCVVTEYKEQNSLPLK